MAVALDGDDRAGETRVMALAGVAARVVNAGLVFLTQLLFARLLGVAEFGVFAAANTIFLLIVGFATLGLAILPQRFWPQYAAAGDHVRLRGLVRFAMLAPFAAGTAFALMGAGGVWLFRDALSPAVASVAMIAMLAIPAQASLDVVEGIALARAWKGLAYGVAFVVRPLLVPALFMAAWFSGAGVSAGTALAALAAASWIAAFILVAAMGLKLRRELPRGPAAMEIGPWLRAALPAMLIDGVFMLMTSVDILLLTLLREDSEVGVYAAAARLVALVAFVHAGLTWASGHHFSALHQAGDRAGLRAYAAQATRWTFLPSVAAAALTALAAPLLLLLFGKDFAGGGLVTAILLLGLLARACVGPAEQLLVMTDNQMATAYAYAWAFVVNLGLALVLVPVWGGAGAAAATACAYAAAAAIIAREVRLRLGFPISILAVLRAPSRRVARA
ncbi:MAG: lipopolysaccharide biosynthesis protein [Beijerinckiaceae bacterium]